MGLIELYVDEAYRRRGLAVFLLSEAFRQFARQGIADRRRPGDAAQRRRVGDVSQAEVSPDRRGERLSQAGVRGGGA